MNNSVDKKIRPIEKWATFDSHHTNVCCFLCTHQYFMYYAFAKFNEYLIWMRMTAVNILRIVFYWISISNIGRMSFTSSGSFCYHLFGMFWFNIKSDLIEIIDDRSKWHRLQFYVHKTFELQTKLKKNIFKEMDRFRFYFHRSRVFIVLHITFLANKQCNGIRVLVCNMHKKCVEKN